MKYEEISCQLSFKRAAKIAKMKKNPSIPLERNLL